MSSTPHAASLAPHGNRDPGDLKDGSFPPRAPYLAGVENGGVVSRDGMLHVGPFRLSIEAMMRYFDSLTRISKRIEKTFPNQEALVRVLPNGEIPIPPASMSFYPAFDTFKAVQCQELRDVDFFRGKRKLEGLTEGAIVSPDELTILRDLLIKGARIATVCAGIDQAMEAALSYRSLAQRGRDWLVDHAGSVGIGDSRVQAKLREMPFEEFGVRSLRIDADLMAQRIALCDDGSPAVSKVTLAERRAGELLVQGALSRAITLSRAGMEGVLTVRDNGGALLHNSKHGFPEVFSALQLGGAASRLVSELSEQRVNLFRLAKFIHRPTALGLKMCLDGIPDHSHARLWQVDSWAPCFESAHPLPLSEDKRRDLGALLLDAHQCLLVVAHLQVVTQTDDARSFWRRLWSASLRDRDVRAAQGLVNQAPSPLEYDCTGAAEVLGNAAMLLGYHAEDRSGAAWVVPENPVVSLTWAMNR